MASTIIHSAGIIVYVGIIFLVWIACGVLRWTGFFSDGQFLFITVAMIIILLCLGRYAYLVYSG